MPAQSMTGFGRAEAVTPSGNFRVEIRGVNNRFLEIQLRIPRSLNDVESDCKKLLSGKLSRGTVQVSINWDREDAETQLTWSREKVANYMKVFREIQQTHSLAGEVTLQDLLGFSDIVKAETVTHDPKVLWKHLAPVLKAAIEDFIKARRKEGAFIQRDMKKQIKRLSSTLGKVQQRAPVRLKNYSEELRRKIASLDTGIDEQRLATEVALMADKLDITEECTRLSAHIQKYGEDLESSAPVGKRLGFLLQEMNREANTIGSKSNDTQIAHMVVTLKEGIEQIREQIQNIE
jgi:uncharacterized protein (TIGR00255 family)